MRISDWSSDVCSSDLTKGLGLAEAGVAQTRNGGIEVDERMRTTRPGTYAAGDVTGLDQFVYMAAHGAKIAARNALNGDALAYDNRVMPAVVFTDPQVASVGWTKASAREAGYEVKPSVLPLDRSEEHTSELQSLIRT